MTAARLSPNEITVIGMKKFVRLVTSDWRLLLRVLFCDPRMWNTYATIDFVERLENSGFDVEVLE